MKFSRSLHKGFLSLEQWEDEAGRSIEVVRTTDSVAGLLYDATNNRVLLVRQQRAPMVRRDNCDGYIVETVAGRFDVDLGPQALLVKEAKEEAGVNISKDDVVLLNDGIPMALSAGVLTERCYMAFAVIHPDHIESGDDGYGVVEEGEVINRVWMDGAEFVRGHQENIRTWAFAQFLKNYLRENGPQ